MVERDVVERAAARLGPDGLVTLVGMAAVGKSTVGGLLARALGWAHVDTDRLLEAYLGARLQDIFDHYGLERFLAAEERMVLAMGAKRCVVSTGGSVVYGAQAVARLKSQGPVVYLRASLDVVLARMESPEKRGLAMAPGQSLEALYQERQALYEAAADIVVDTDSLAPTEAVDVILQRLGGEA